ncbi:MAG: cytidine deaminase [Clostridia bacterium]|nr:cytidine deaminase [Clostridia bacterium]
MATDKKTVEKLLTAAKNARENAYAPYSNFKVGAALLAESGEIFAGANFENVSFGAGSCAERVALGSAVAAGERKFSAIAVCGGEDIPAAPCGICRQALSEFGDMEVFCINGRGENMKKFMLSQLLPEAFSSITD